MSTHECPVEGCPVEVSGDHLLCREHWFTVPKRLRDGVWAAYRAWQRSHGTLGELLEAQEAAIAAADEAAKQGSFL